MNFIDILFCIPLIWAVYKGFTNGLVIEIASLGALILGIYGAIHFSNYMGTLLTNTFHAGSRYISVISFVLTFAGIIIAVHFLARILEKLLKVMALGFINRLLGVLFGILKMAFVLSIIILIINAVDGKKIIISEKTQNSSLFYKPISKVAPYIMPALKNLYFHLPSSLNQPKENG